jgi:hypothetical protein
VLHISRYKYTENVKDSSTNVRLAQCLAADGAEAAFSARRHHGEDHVVSHLEVIHLFADLLGGE